VLSDMVPPVVQKAYPAGIVPAGSKTLNRKVG
jgi:hypothetical protein